MIVTIDGPSGSGKSTAARTLAAKLGLEFLDTGAMFRAIAWSLHRAQVDAADANAVGCHLENFDLTMHAGIVRVGDSDITTIIRTPEVTAASSRIAIYPHIRTFLAQQQRLIATGRSIISEGRDQGTVVFPHATLKFFLTASPRVRAERRWRELLAKGEVITLEEVLHSQEERDRRDSSRAVAPLMPAPDAKVIDTSTMHLDTMLTLMEQEIRQCSPG